MAHKVKEIKAVLHLPKSDKALDDFERKMCVFYINQVEKRIHHLPKEQKLDVVQSLMNTHQNNSNRFVTNLV